MASNWMVSRPRKRRKSKPQLYDRQALVMFQMACGAAHTRTRSVQEVVDVGRQLVERAITKMRPQGKIRGRGRRFRL
jgi:hypothetical protein